MTLINFLQYCLGLLTEHQIRTYEAGTVQINYLDYSEWVIERL